MKNERTAIKIMVAVIIALFIIMISVIGILAWSLICELELLEDKDEGGLEKYVRESYYYA